jgi:hypothetical protein
MFDKSKTNPTAAIVRIFCNCKIYFDNELVLLKSDDTIKNMNDLLKFCR